MKLQAVFTLIDKMSKPVSAVSKVVTGLSGVFSKVGINAGKMQNRINAASELVETFGEKAEVAEKKSNRFAKALAFLGSVVSVATFVSFGKSVIDVNSKFEQYQATLTTVLGTQEKANAAMAWVTDFAAKTPYDIDQVTESFVMMNAYGMNAMDGTLEAAGNWASAMGKNINQVVEAFADARTGEFERLKELGVVSKSTKDKVTFTFGDMTKTVKKNAKDIQAALKEIADAKFAGAMIKQAKTMQGLMSGLSDWWTNFQLKIGRAGLFDHIKSKIGGLLDSLNALNGKKSDKWATDLSNSLSHLFDALWNLVTKIDWVKLIDSFTKFVVWLTETSAKVVDFINKMGGIEGIINLGIAVWIAGIVYNLLTLGGALPILILFANLILGLEIAAAPIMLIIAAIALLAAGAFLLWRNWGKVKKWWGETWASISSKVASAVGAMTQKFEEIKGKFSEVINSLWNLMPAWMQGLIGGTLHLIAPDVKWPSAPNSPSAALGQNSNKYSADVNINYRGPGKISAPKSSSSNLRVNTNQDLGYQD